MCNLKQLLSIIFDFSDWIFRVPFVTVVTIVFDSKVGVSQKPLKQEIKQWGTTVLLHLYYNLGSSG